MGKGGLLNKNEVVHHPLCEKKANLTTRRGNVCSRSSSTCRSKRTRQHLNFGPLHNLLEEIIKSISKLSLHKKNLQAIKEQATSKMNSAKTVIHFVQPAKLGCTIAAQHVDRSSVTLGVWHWRKWLSHLSYPANTTH